MSFAMRSFLYSLAAARTSFLECGRLDASPDDDGGDRLSDNADSNKVHGRPLHAHGIEDVVDLNKI